MQRRRRLWEEPLTMTVRVTYHYASLSWVANASKSSSKTESRWRQSRLKTVVEGLILEGFNCRPLSRRHRRGRLGGRLRRPRRAKGTRRLAPSLPTGPTTRLNIPRPSYASPGPPLLPPRRHSGYLSFLPAFPSSTPSHYPPPSLNWRRGRRALARSSYPSVYIERAWTLFLHRST